MSLITVLFLLSGFSCQAAPTFADLAVLLAKDYFKGHLKKEATLEECVSFLNGHGICFSLFDVMDSAATVTREDVARGLGQSTLLFLGEAALDNGCIKQPEEADSWVDYCLLNDVDFDPVWNRLLRRTENGMLPEVRKFFGRAL